MLNYRNYQMVLLEVFFNAVHIEDNSNAGNVVKPDLNSSDLLREKF